MPFTPFHFGPGLALKGAFGRRLSFVAFAVANIAIDIEPAYYLLRGEPPLHRLAHSWLGAALLATLLFAMWLPLRWLARRMWHSRNWRWLHALRNATGAPVWLGLMLGTLSHIALDSLMHADMQPFAPFAADNPWLGLMSLEQLHWLCIMAGIAAAPIIVLRRE